MDLLLFVKVTPGNILMETAPTITALSNSRPYEKKKALIGEDLLQVLVPVDHLWLKKRKALQAPFLPSRAALPQPEDAEPHWRLPPLEVAVDVVPHERVFRVNPSMKETRPPRLQVRPGHPESGIVINLRVQVGDDSHP